MYQGLKIDYRKADNFIRLKGIGNLSWQQIAELRKRRWMPFRGWFIKPYTLANIKEIEIVFPELTR